MATVKNTIVAGVKISSAASSAAIDGAVVAVAKTAWTIAKAPVQVVVSPVFMYMMREEILELAKSMDAAESQKAAATAAA
jgi:hypothetical protein